MMGEQIRLWRLHLRECRETQEPITHQMPQLGEFIGE